MLQYLTYADDFIRLRAISIIFWSSSNFLQEDLSLTLAKYLKIDLESLKPASKKAKMDNAGNVSSGGPKDDFSKDFNKGLLKNASAEVTSSKQKALAKSAKGTKSIASFFGKK